MRGLMIDCSRLTEQHRYYHDLLKNIADWGYDTLVLHFCDDHGLAVILPGFEDLAAPHAIPTNELREIVALGKMRGIRVIPEIECFGHSRWLVGHPKWDACFIGDRSEEELRFNAVDPTNPLTTILMDRLIHSVCRIFTDEIIHIGCDEVDISGFCQQRHLGDPIDVWSGWVNTLIDMVRAHGRRAMLWADHLEHEERIRRAIDKNTIVVSWHYGSGGDATADGMQRLLDAGFRDVISAPAIQCASTRIHAQERNLINVKLMDQHARTVGAAGTLDTIWCPFRHLQGSLWHGIAVASHIHASGNLPEDDGAAIADRLFGGGNAATRRICRDLHRIECHHEIFTHLWHGTAPDSTVLSDALDVIHHSSDLLPYLEKAEVPNHQDWLEAMCLGIHCARELGKRLLQPELSRNSLHQRTLRELTQRLQAEWDSTRFQDDPAREKPRWSANWGHHYLLPLMTRLTASDRCA